MSAEFVEHPPTNVPTITPGRGRWVIGAAIFSIAVIAQLILWMVFHDDRTFSKMSVLFVWPAALFFLALWWTFLSAQPWIIRGGVWGVIAVGLIVTFSIFAMDGVDGEMVPRFRYRWEKSAKQNADEYFSRQSPASVPANDAPSEAEEEAEPWQAVAGDWPGFRGPKRDGIVQGVKLRSDWSTKPPKELWRHPVGLGWSAFAIVGEFAFTQEQRGPEECVVCYRLGDGVEAWIHGDQTRLKIVEVNGGDGPHGTPQFHDGLLYTLGGTGILNCLDARTGRRKWTTNILVDAGDEKSPAKNIEWGMSGTPLIIDNLVIASPGGTEGRSTIAYDRLTGERVWAAGEYPAGYASPMHASIDGVPQIIVFHGTGIAGHDFASGQVLWNFKWENGPKVNSAQPIVFGDGSIFLGCSYGVGSVRIDVRQEPGSGWSANARYKSPKFRPKFNDFVMKDGYIYGLDDGILCCVDIATGKVKWKDRAGQYGYGQLLLVDDVLLILSEQGELVQAAASPDGFQEITKFPALDAICWNHLAIGHGKLLIRNSHAAVCFELD